MTYSVGIKSIPYFSNLSAKASDQHMHEYLFSYGTLQKKPVQRALFGRILQGKEDVLSGYKISTIEITDEAFLPGGEEKRQPPLLKSGDPNDRTNGTVFELTVAELQAADQYEPANYTREKAVLDSGREAWIYVASHEPPAFPPETK